MFCRFLELYLVSAFHAACAIGIIATNIAVRQASKRESGGPGYAYGIFGHPFPRAPRSESPGCPGQERSEVTAFWIDLEGLESRTLLSTIPAATATAAPIDLSGLSSVTSNGNANSPTVVVDPYDSQKLIAVWGVDLSQVTPTPPLTTAVVRGLFSTNGGAGWTFLNGVSDPLFDPLTVNNTSPPFFYTHVTDPSAGFDSQGNVYILTLQNSAASDGAL